ncbi:MAG: META domain-containing protein [Bacteroidetes bacterium]|nr:META domain-containing protein [Bacteroidota bacterium]
MKTNQLILLLFSSLFLLSNCKKEQIGTDFLHKEWKVKSVTNGSKYLVPSGKMFREEAYILKFVNDSIFNMNTSVNYGGGEYQIISEGNIIINSGEWTMVGNTNEFQRNFDEQLLLLFNGAMTYSYTKNKLIFRGEQNREVVFERRK